MSPIPGPQGRNPPWWDSVSGRSTAGRTPIDGAPGRRCASILGLVVEERRHPGAFVAVRPPISAPRVKQRSMGFHGDRGLPTRPATFIRIARQLGTKPTPANPTVADRSAARASGCEARRSGRAGKRTGSPSPLLGSICRPTSQHSASADPMRSAISRVPAYPRHPCSDQPMWLPPRSVQAASLGGAYRGTGASESVVRTAHRPPGTRTGRVRSSLNGLGHSRPGLPMVHRRDANRGRSASSTAVVRTLPCTRPRPGPGPHVAREDRLERVVLGCSRTCSVSLKKRFTVASSPRPARRRSRRSSAVSCGLDVT